MTDPLRILSLGAGVQSTALLQMGIEGEIQIDHAIFADTGWEPKAVYVHLRKIAHRAAKAGIPVHTVSAGNIRDTDAKLFRNIPYFLEAAPGGEPGFGKRQCTQRSKIAPIRQRVREIMAQSGHTIRERPAVIQMIGISWDEIQRMKPSDVKFIDHEWPLVERKMTRADCREYLEGRKIDAPRSACIGCPFHSNAEWRRLKNDSPEEFADAVRFEREIQDGRTKLRAKPFLHSARVPLDEIDFRSAEDVGQLTFNDECEGMCGV